MPDGLRSNERRRTTSLLALPMPWAMVALGVVLLMCANIPSNTFGVFFKPISEDFVWSRSTMSAAAAIRFLVSALVVLLMSYWADRYGPRRILVPSFLLVGASVAATAGVHSVWQLYLVQGVLLGMGGGALFAIVVATVAKWHGRTPGMALGIASAGIGLSSIIFPPLATKLILSLGWRNASLILGLIIAVTSAPASLAMKNPPVADRQPAGGNAAARGPLGVWRLLPRLLRGRALQSVILMFMLFYLGGNMLTYHLVNYATDIHITQLTAAGMMSVMGITSTGGRLVLGAMSDRIGTKLDSAICCSLLAVAFLLLATKIISLMWVAAGLFGVGFGGTAPLIPAMMSERVGTEHLSTATGLATIGASLGTAMGPWMGGAIFDISGSYLPALLLSAAFSVAALAITLWLPSPKHEVWQEDPGPALRMTG